MPMFSSLAGDTTRIATYSLIAFQLLVAYVCWRATMRPLARQRNAIRRILGTPGSETPVEIGPEAPFELQDAWRRVTPDGDHREVMEVADAFDPDELLPSAYNGRLDSAAPGLFTGLGIAGTFLGLIYAFSRIDPARAESSIQPLIHGMQIAFDNSLAGVVLALVWTVMSRHMRHSFDVVSRDLGRAIEIQIGRRTPGDQVLAAFSSLQQALSGSLATLQGTFAGNLTGLQESMSHSLQALQSTTTENSAALQNTLGGLQSTTIDSSRELLEKLVPALEQTFKSLVDMPFDRLEGAVSAYGKSVQEAAEKQSEVVSSLFVAGSLLADNKKELGNALAATAAHVKEFDRALLTMKDQTAASTSIVAQARTAAESLATTAKTIIMVGEQHGALAGALGGAVIEMRQTSGSLASAAGQFDTAASRLENSAGRIEGLSVEAAESSAHAARAELQLAIADIATALRQFGIESAASFELSSGRVIASVNAGLSEMTDKLAPSLNALSVGLPDAMSRLAGATREAPAEIVRAVRALDDAVRQLDAGTRQSLAAQLAQYDKALAEAVDRFSGTLTMWDGKIADLASVSNELRAAMGARATK